MGLIHFEQEIIFETDNKIWQNILIVSQIRATHKFIERIYFLNLSIRWLLRFGFIVTFVNVPTFYVTNNNFQRSLLFSH